MHTKRLWLAKLTLLAISTLLAVLAMEALVRVSGRDRPLLWEPDPQLGWRHIPNAALRWREEGDGQVLINGLGFRDAERTERKDDGVFRIVVFGDSTTEAVQVNLDQTFTQLLEGRLRGCRPRVEVLNFGVSGYGPLQEYLLYTLRGRAFSPDLVIQATFLDNDVADGDRRLAAGQRGAPFLKPSPPDGFEIDHSAAVASFESYRREPVHSLRRLSAIYRMVSASRSRNLAASAVQVGPAAEGQVPRRFLLYEDPVAREWEEAWQTFERVVTKFAAAVRADGASYAILSMPAGQVVYPEVWQGLLTEHSAMSSRKWEVRGPENRLQQLAERHQVPLIAPLDAFAAAAPGDPLFFQRIGHLTPRGHQVLAALLETALIEGGLVSGGCTTSR